MEDWEAECRGLGAMILEIKQRYLQARDHLGGDSELLASAILTYASYVDIELRAKLGSRDVS